MRDRHTIDAELTLTAVVAEHGKRFSAVADVLSAIKNARFLAEGTDEVVALLAGLGVTFAKVIETP